MDTEWTDDEMTKFENQPFSALVKEDDHLSALRLEYASVPPQERRKAADWEYHSQMANEIFNDSMAVIREDGLRSIGWPSGIVALAIDPLYGPAILTVGSIEYQVGRIEEAMKLFYRLLELPKNEEDLSIIIDKAGDFLIDQEDYENSLSLYSAAEKVFPHEVIYPVGAGYCLGKLGYYEKSVEKYRIADSLEPDNYKNLNDLGYALLEAGKLDEAEEVLRRSISLAPSDYEFPHNNLSELGEKRREKRQIMKNDVLNKLFLMFERYSPKIKPNADSQMCLLWPIKDPPDVLEGTKQFEAIEAEFEITISEDEAVEMYDMNLQEASEYIQELITAQ